MFKRRDGGTEVRAENLIDMRNGVCFSARISGTKVDGGQWTVLKRWRVSDVVQRGFIALTSMCRFVCDLISRAGLC